MEKNTPLHRAATLCSDGLSRAIQGVIRTWWIAPTLFGYVRAEQLRSAKEHTDLVINLALVVEFATDTVWPTLQYMIIVGIPILFILTLLRANQPVVVCAVSVALTDLYLWKTMPMLDASSIGLHSFVVAVVSLAAAVAARSDVPLDFSWLVRKRRP